MAEIGSGYRVEVEHPPLAPTFRSMVREGGYDVCEMAMTTVIAALRHPQNFVAVPAFVVRSLPFDAMWCNVASRVRGPDDLGHRRVGVRAITGTAVFWVRGILSVGYGLDQDTVTWVTTDEDYIREVELPSNVAHVPGGDLGAMLSTGEVAAGINATGVSPGTARPLFEDPGAAARSWLGSTGIYPLNHVIVIDRAKVAEDPDLPEKVYRALEMAKRCSGGTWPSGMAPSEMAKLVGGDPLPYGLDANRPSLEAALDMACAQGILTDPVPIEDLFAPGVGKGESR
jgi:4,5-dihydroxyphthalate decarboxylase